MSLIKGSGIFFLVASSACGAPQPPVPVTASQTCAYEIVQPDKGAKAAAFRAWLKPKADELGLEVNSDPGDVYIADLDNDGIDETIFAQEQGSGSYLYLWVFRGEQNKWTLVEHLPFDDQLLGAQVYRGPLMNEPQLVARLCGKTIINLMGGLEPNYFPVGLLWEGTTAKRVCRAEWLTRHQRAANDLEKKGMLDEARVLLDGVQQGCESEAPEAVHAIRDDLVRIKAAAARSSAATYDFSWLIEAIKRDPDQQLVLDARFTQMLVVLVPDAQLGNESLRGAVKKSVWLPDPAKIIDGRYIVLSGCEPHNCGNKGLLWIDLQTKQAIAITGGLLASRTVAPEKIPDPFFKHALEAMGDWADETVDFIDASGKTAKVRVP